MSVELCRHQRDGAGSQLTRRDNIIHYQHGLAGRDRVLLDLEEVLAVLLLEAGLHRRARELSRLSNGCEAGTQAQGQRWAEEEATGVETDDHVGGLAIVEGSHLQLERTDEGLVQRGRGEKGEDVDEVDAGNREVREVS